jgi:hypothetical protein
MPTESFADLYPVRRRSELAVSIVLVVLDRGQPDIDATLSGCLSRNYRLMFPPAAQALRLFSLSFFRLIFIP